MKKVILSAVLTLLFVAPTLLMADTDSTAVNATISNPLKGGISTIPALLNAIVDQILIPIGAILAVLAFIWAGFKFVTAAGNEPKIQEAKRALLYAAIGTAILLGAKVITTVLTGTIGSLTTP